MLGLHTPSYAPFSQFVIIADPACSAEPDYLPWYSYDMLDSLSGTPYAAALGEYRIPWPSYAGWEVLPRAPGAMDDFNSGNLVRAASGVCRVYLFADPPDWPGQPGRFGVDWLGYHGSSSDGSPVLVCPGLVSLADGRPWDEIVTHEFTEALMDSPPGSGWYDDGTGEESADDCENLAPSSVPWTAMSGNEYRIARFWSNARGVCVPGTATGPMGQPAAPGRVKRL